MGDVERSGPAGLAWRPAAVIGAGEWTAQGRRIVAVGRAWRWWLGDWLIYGERHFPRELEELDLDVDRATLGAAMDVARAFPPSRRRGHLSWSHHAAVVTLEEAEQDAALNAAEASRWTVSQLRERVEDQALAVAGEHEREARQPTLRDAAPAPAEPAQAPAPKDVRRGSSAREPTRFHASIDLTIGCLDESQARRLCEDVVAYAEGLPGIAAAARSVLRPVAER